MAAQSTGNETSTMMETSEADSVSMATVSPTSACPCVRPEEETGESKEKTTSRALLCRWQHEQARNWQGKTLKGELRSESGFGGGHETRQEKTGLHHSCCHRNT
jgi:hypothetical protein